MVTGEITLRDYCAADLDAVIAVFQSAVREVASMDYDQAQIEAWSSVDRPGWAAARLSRPTWVAVSDGRVVGFSDLTRQGLLDMMFVRGDFQRRGVARLLIERVLGAAMKAGLRSVETEASITARPFFERHGFVVQARQEVQKRGQTLINFKMRRVL
jgi:putative acetyltransferase